MTQYLVTYPTSVSLCFWHSRRRGPWPVSGSHRVQYTAVIESNEATAGHVENGQLQVGLADQSVTPVVMSSPAALVDSVVQ